MPVSKIDNTDPFFLARDLCAHLCAQLDLMTLQPQTILVLGLLAEESAEVLAKRFAGAEIKIVTDTEMLPVADYSVDLIFANLLLPWCRDLKTVFREWRRVVRQDGLVHFSSLGPDTLIELREHYANSLLPNLIDMHNVGDELMQVRFADPVMDTEFLTVTYRDTATLRHELIATKMLVADVGELQLIPNAAGAYVLTYEIVYGHAWGPNPLVDQVADESGVVKIPLAHLRRRRL